MPVVKRRKLETKVEKDKLNDYTTNSLQIRSKQKKLKSTLENIMANMRE